MTMLTEKQQQALLAAGGEPLRLIDPVTNQSYVLLPSESYDRLRALFEETPLSKGEKRAHLRRAGGRTGWDDAELDVYNDRDPRRP